MNAGSGYRGPVVVLGAHGQVGKALIELLGPEGIALGRGEADLSRPESLAGVLSRYTPRAVINAAAYTLVDRAESERELAFRINGEAPGAIARWCREQGIPFVHYSTDYVFNGSGDQPWTEQDAVDPLNAYGASKLEGECQVKQAGERWLVFRTSWVYDASGKNFLNTMLRLGAERETLSVVADQFGAPTYAPHLAAATLQVLQDLEGRPDFPSGIYHLCNTGTTQWHAFACRIFEKARAEGLALKVSEVKAIPAAAYPTPARRPSNSRLSTARAKEVLHVELPSWEAGLEECFQERKKLSPA